MAGLGRCRTSSTLLMRSWGSEASLRDGRFYALLMSSFWFLVPFGGWMLRLYLNKECHLQTSCSEWEAWTSALLEGTYSNLILVDLEHLGLPWRDGEHLRPSSLDCEDLQPPFAEVVVRLSLGSVLSIAPTLLETKSLPTLVEEWWNFKLSSSDWTDLRHDFLGACFHFLFFDIECLKPLRGEGEHLRSSLGGDLDLKVNSDASGGEITLGGVEVEHEFFLTFMEDVSPLLAEGTDLKASSSESEYLISPSGNGAWLAIFLVELEHLWLLLG